LENIYHYIVYNPLPEEQHKSCFHPKSRRYPKVPQGWNSEGEKDVLPDNWGAPAKDQKHKPWITFRSVDIRNTPEKNIGPTWAELRTQSTTATVLPEKLTSVCTKETAPLPVKKRMSQLVLITNWSLACGIEMFQMYAGKSKSRQEDVSRGIVLSNCSCALTIHNYWFTLFQVSAENIQTKTTCKKKTQKHPTVAT